MSAVGGSGAGASVTGFRSPASARIVRSSGVLAAGIGLSRVLGFVRDILMARLFGATVQSEAFVVAFRLPNLMRDLVAEGAVTSAFVPVLSWHRAKANPDEFWRLNAALLCRLLVVLCGIGALGVVAAPQVVYLVAPGFASDPEKFALTVRLTRLLFPFITLVGLWAYFMGLLNTLGHFSVPALGSAILNLAMIVACIWFVGRMSPGIMAVAVSVMIGGVIQLLIQLPVARRFGFRWRWQWTHPGANEALRLLGPRMLGSAVYQISVLVDTALASLGGIVGAGAVVALYFANRLVQLPLAMFGNTFAQASLPSLAEQAAHNDLKGFQSTLLSVIRMVGFVALPSAVGLIVLAHPIVGGLFERGAFDHRATLMTSQALICYSFGLLAYCLTNVLTGAFYALRDTWTPVRLSFEALAVNIIFSVALMWPMKVAGLALAAALSNSYNAYRLLRCMETRLGAPVLGPLGRSLPRTVLASLAMGAACWAAWTLTAAHLHAWAGLLAAITLGATSYMALCALLRVQEIAVVFRWINVPFLRRSASK